MTNRFDALSRRAQRGSKPRCHLLTDGPDEIVAQRLTALVKPHATVSPSDNWMPRGFIDVAEAELHKAERLLDSHQRKTLTQWWLPEDRGQARTPNFDIASTCKIGGERGLLLIEAKAHDKELISEKAGRRLSSDSSVHRKESHATIGNAIENAGSGLESYTGFDWGISRDSHYQLSNRFAWSWKLTQMGIPVVLVYLGFLDADEMFDQGVAFESEEQWGNLVRDHSAGVVPAEIWGQDSRVNGVRFVPLIRAVCQPLDQAAK